MASACAHGAPSTRSSGEVAEALRIAEADCAAAGEAWTPPRDRVYRLLLASDHPLKAYDLIARFKADGTTKPPTVYRALDFLMARGLAHRLETEGAFIPCAVAGQHDTGVGFLICDCCGDVAELALDESQVRSRAAASGFAVDSVVMEAHGACPRCVAEHA